MLGQKLVSLISVTSEYFICLEKNLEFLSKISKTVLVYSEVCNPDVDKICKQYGNVALITQKDFNFWGDESTLRYKMYHTALKLNPDWILSLDADEMFESDFSEKLPSFMANKNFTAWGFRIFDHWHTSDYYREDPVWKRHLKYQVRLVKNIKQVFDWENVTVNAPHYPYQLIEKLKIGYSNIPLRNFSHLNVALNKKKHDIWKEVDIKNIMVSNEYLDSLLDENPLLYKYSWNQNTKKKILIGSPVRHSSKILKDFFAGLQALDIDGLDVDYCFIDDNIDEDASLLLSKMEQKFENFSVIKELDNVQLRYKRDISGTNLSQEKWPTKAALRVGNMRNYLLEKARVGGYDFFFMLDTDLVLRKQTLKHLMELEKQVVSEIFWTKWKECSIPHLPQVWMSGKYDFYTTYPSDVLTKEEINYRSIQFIHEISQKGQHIVGGLGACTLFNKEFLSKKINYDPLPHISMAGEDRHFCIRLASLNIPMYADSMYSPYHLYEESELSNSEYLNFKTECGLDDVFKSFNDEMGVLCKTA